MILLTFADMRAEMVGADCPDFSAPGFIRVDMESVEIFAYVVQGLHLRLDSSPDVSLNP